DKNKEFDADKIIGPDEKLQINSCGRLDSASGAEGSFDFVDDNDHDKMSRHCYWPCPWGSKTNTRTVSGSNTKWMVEHHGRLSYGRKKGESKIVR
ncbi:aegerolysin family protein, partial [Moniliophthora roreri MCA 2997]